MPEHYGWLLVLAFIMGGATAGLFENLRWKYKYAKLWLDIQKLRKQIMGGAP
jgi:hypothetical protein